MQYNRILYQNVGGYGRNALKYFMYGTTELCRQLVRIQFFAKDKVGISAAEGRSNQINIAEDRTVKLKACYPDQVGSCFQQYGIMITGLAEL